MRSWCHDDEKRVEKTYLVWIFSHHGITTSDSTFKLISKSLTSLLTDQTVYNNLFQSEKFVFEKFIKHVCSKTKGKLTPLCSCILLFIIQHNGIHVVRHIVKPNLDRMFAFEHKFIILMGLELEWDVFNGISKVDLPHQKTVIAGWCAIECALLCTWLCQRALEINLQRVRDGLPILHRVPVPENFTPAMYLDSASLQFNIGKLLMKHHQVWNIFDVIWTW